MNVLNPRALTLLVCFLFSFQTFATSKPNPAIAVSQLEDGEVSIDIPVTPGESVATSFTITNDSENITRHSVLNLGSDIRVENFVVSGSGLALEVSTKGCPNELYPMMSCTFTVTASIEDEVFFGESSEHALYVPLATTSGDTEFFSVVKIQPVFPQLIHGTHTNMD